MDEQTLSQPERERLNPIVTQETAIRLKVMCAVRGLTMGELIDELASKHLPAVTIEQPATDAA